MKKLSRILLPACLAGIDMVFIVGTTWLSGRLFSDDDHDSEVRLIIISVVFILMALHKIKEKLTCVNE